MSNSFYNHGAFPSTGSSATSASMRAELDLVSAGFDKMPTLSGNANYVILVNGFGTGLTASNALPAVTLSGTVSGGGNQINNVIIGSSTPLAGAFTTLSASSTVSGTGFSTYLASPPAIGGTAAAAITGTTITASTAFSGPHNGTVGATTASTGAFTTLSASSTVSGTGFSTYLASPPAIGGTAAAAGTFTSVRGTSTTITGSAGGTITPTSDTTNQYTITALGGTATFAVPSGTPIDGQKLIIRIKDNGTARTLTWTTSAGGYRVIGCFLPTTTVISKVIYVGCVYNSQDSYWDVVGVIAQG